MGCYLDHAATTPVRPEAVEAMLAAMTQDYGNPSSRHEMGTAANRAVSVWRNEVALALGCDAGEVYFTSGGTEGNNWAIASAALAGRRLGRHIITTALEHDAVLNPMKALEQQGFSVTYLPPDETGGIDMESLERALRPDTVLVSMMLVNNEIGRILPVVAAAQAIARAGAPALLHTDAVQGLFKVPFEAKELGAQLLTVSAHKVQGPKGIGALYIKRGTKLAPLLLGGGQESGLRAGTEPTQLIAGFGAACRAGRLEMGEAVAHMAEIKDYARKELFAALPGLKPVGEGDAPHILCLSLPGFQSEVLVRFLSDRGIYVSAGSACHRGKPSHVLSAMKLTPKVRTGAFRISVSPRSTRAEIDRLKEGLLQAKKELFVNRS